MRVLDVSNLHGALDETIQAINEKIEGLETIEKSIAELVNLDRSFTGKGPNAIKSYYQSCHQPFLFKLKQILVSYQLKLQTCKEQVNSYEPNHTGFIHDDFLQGELTKRLTEVQNYTNDVTADANQFISNVLDIVHVKLLDDAEVNQQVEQAKQSINNTVTKLEDFDVESTSSLDQLTVDLQVLTAYIEEMDTKAGVNPRSLETFSPLQALMSPTHALLMGSIRSTPMHFFTNGTLAAKRST
ncbi:MAG TPA: LXG domain-containing protein, partial [Metabacillus sp.]|nr:LXG domain-containing protein [Metabacillus sp.]